MRHQVKPAGTSSSSSRGSGNLRSRKIVLLGVLLVGVGLLFNLDNRPHDVGPDRDRSTAVPPLEMTPASTAAPTLALTIAAPAPTSAKIPSRVFDCFIFHSEFDWLEIHLGELFDVVDVFVLVEAKQNFLGKSKPAAYAELGHTKIPAKLRSKVFSVVIEDFDPLIVHMNDTVYDLFGAQWKRERAQRERLWTALIEAGVHVGDLIHLGDTDEVPHPNAIRKASQGCFQYNETELSEHSASCGAFPIALRLTSHIYNLRWYGQEIWWGTEMFRYNGTNIQGVRRSSIGVERAIVYFRPWTSALQYRGWHCSWCYRSLTDIHLKFQRFSHQELNRNEWTNLESIQKSVCIGHTPFYLPTTNTTAWQMQPVTFSTFFIHGHIARKIAVRWLQQLAPHRLSDSRFHKSNLTLLTDPEMPRVEFFLAISAQADLDQAVKDQVPKGSVVPLALRRAIFYDDSRLFLHGDSSSGLRDGKSQDPVPETARMVPDRLSYLVQRNCTLPDQADEVQFEKTTLFEPPAACNCNRT